MQNKRILIIVGAVALILGAAVAFLSPSPSVEQAETAVDQSLKDLRDQVSKLSETVEVLSAQADKKAVVIREKVRAEVVHLSPDGVCIALNDELRSFRGICVDPPGADGHGD
ncbi:hypothetical protein [Aminirod propionatiphilus]|uniref:Uncharacterized protein n=1 Tax=Aminirod propionatiphilus TaxID=3415223 RepID=A0ACD1DYJ4_9BACT|nr:hypothetical protein KIH16_04520 [Synergistota bacterium]